MPDPARLLFGRLARSLVALALSPVLAACDDGTAFCDPGLQDCGQAADTGGQDLGDADARPGDATDDVPPADDADADGIPDDVEGDGDPDDDGLPNYLDDDSDGDGVLDRDETDSDEDEDGVPSFLDDDSDGDGFPDSAEGAGDPDGDGLPNSRDTDSDGDGLPDDFEGDVDSDGDRILDRYDMDSDNDTIPDRFEGAGDPDLDELPNYLDDDSDGDGWTDAEEYGRVAGSDLRPVESDDDRIPDFLDLDSDGDGLPDHLESGCPESTDRTRADSDGDGFTDLVEVSFTAGGDAEGQACDPDRDIADDVDFFFELPYLEGDPKDAPLDFLANVRRADIAFNMDTTGSMGGEVSQLQTSLTSVLIPALSREIADSAYAFSQFDDFPCSSYGGGEDRPFILRQRVTTSVGAATAGVMALDLHGGGDYFESGFESIYQVCTGHGRNDACSDGVVDVLAFDPDLGHVPGVADGQIGGVGFRDGALPIIVHITDAPSHVKGEGSPVYRHGASRNETYAAMRTIGAKLIGVASGADARNHLEQMAIQAGSVVPACAWTDPVDGGRPLGCAAAQCCTGGSGVGRTPTDGVCPLVYDISSSGSGLDSSVVAGVQALINFASFDLTTRVRPDEEWLALGVDTSEFIEAVIPVEGTAPATGCASDPELADVDRDGVLDHFLGVVPGSALQFDVVAYNDAVAPANIPIVYNAWIDVVQQGGAVLDTRLVTILVPPALKPTD